MASYTQENDKRDYSKAMHWNDERMKSATFGTALYALVAYDRAGILKTMEKNGLIKRILT